MEPLELEFTVACDPARAFSLWAEQTSRWWPHGQIEHYRRVAMSFGASAD